jgi:formate dehydrogenase subunit gamma
MDDAPAHPAEPEIWSEPRGRAVIAAAMACEGPLLPVLHALQEAFGCVPEAAVPLAAEMLNLTRAEVHGVVTFYRDFRRAPAGRHVLALCRAEACQAMGAEALVAQAQARLGVVCGETTADRAVTLDQVYCLGLCSVAPGAMLDGAVRGRLDAAALDAIIADLRP